MLFSIPHSIYHVFNLGPYSTGDAVANVLGLAATVVPAGVGSFRAMGAGPPVSRLTGARARILYDADCGFCRWALGWVLRWDRHGELEPIALQDPRAPKLLPGLDHEQRLASWHLVEPDGSVSSGGAAAAPLARRLPAGSPLAALFDAGPGVVDRAYRCISGSRNRLGPRLSRGAVARADALIAHRQAERVTRPLA